MFDSTKNAISLHEGDPLALRHITRDVLSVFPEEVLAAFRDTFSLTSICISPISPPKWLNYEQILSGAYFGYLAVPVDYNKFCDDADRICRKRVGTLADELRRNERLREEKAAQQFGLPGRRAMRALYETLKQLAKQRGFPTIKLIWRCQDHIDKAPGMVTEAERSALSAGPLFLWDIVQHARTKKLKNVAFAADGPWVLYLHHVDDNVLAYAINPASLRIGGFEETPFPAPSEAIRESLRAFARDRFPDVPVFIEEFPVFEQAVPYPAARG